MRYSSILSLVFAYLEIMVDRVGHQINKRLYMILYYLWCVPTSK